MDRKRLKVNVLKGYFKALNAVYAHFKLHRALKLTKYKYIKITKYFSVIHVGSQTASILTSHSTKIVILTENVSGLFCG